MAELKGNTRRLSINLSIFGLNDQNTKSNVKSPKNFEEPNGVVGLGIVAALNNDLDQTLDPFSSAKSSRAAILAISPRSNPIPILSKTFSSVSAKFGRPNLADVEDMELSEGYTCVISHIGNNLIKKREYFDGEFRCGSESTTSYWVSSGLFSASSPAAASEVDLPEFGASDFLNSCNLCKKLLHGLDIFMYRGEKAFCSADCRSKHISVDEHRENCASRAMKPLEHSLSPCCGTMQFLAGVAAA
ncbi:unnamed protein product [Ilex paraguariensis]|uniref:FLZ-type domain-containing protein n=1 Tax=Ilex paraguariensis TaxID=185542 RepID=A0ABC8TH29_9AQUA